MSTKLVRRPLGASVELGSGLTSPGSLHSLRIDNQALTASYATRRPLGQFRTKLTRLDRRSGALKETAKSRGKFSARAVPDNNLMSVVALDHSSFTYEFALLGYESICQLPLKPALIIVIVFFTVFLALTFASFVVARLEKDDLTGTIRELTCMHFIKLSKRFL